MLITSDVKKNQIKLIFLFRLIRDRKYIEFSIIHFVKQIRPLENVLAQFDTIKFITLSVLSELLNTVAFLHAFDSPKHST